MNWKAKSRLFTTAIVFLYIFASLGTTLSSAQERNQSGELYQLLKNDMDFSRNDFKEMENSKIVTKRLDTNVKHEVAFFSITRIDVPKDFFIQNYWKDGMNVETLAAEKKGEFSSSPEIADVNLFTMPPGDLEELARCKLSKCSVKASADLINEFCQLDESTPDFEEKANGLIRQKVVEYVREYLKDGNAALAVYNDRKKPIRIADEFQDLLKKSQYPYAYVPELYTYLREFPNSELYNVKNIFFWMKENFGGKVKYPIISINHIVYYQQPDANIEMIVASKQLYATHYFEAALGLTLMVSDSESSEPDFYLIHINRSRIDFLRDIPGFLAKYLLKGAHNLLHKKMTIVKKNMEDAYNRKKLLAMSKY